MKGKKGRELALRESIREQIEETRDTKLFKLAKRCELCTVVLLWSTALGVMVATGMSLLYVFS